MASQLAAGRSITPSCNIMGNSGLNAKRPIPMATAKDNMQANAMAKGWRNRWLLAGCEFMRPIVPG